MIPVGDRPGAYVRLYPLLDYPTEAYYHVAMTTKEKVMESLQDLPDDVSIEDVMERLLFLSKIQEGIRQADAGHTLSHAQVKESMAKWLK